MRAAVDYFTSCQCFLEEESEQLINRRDAGNSVSKECWLHFFFKSVMLELRGCIWYQRSWGGSKLGSLAFNHRVLPMDKLWQKGFLSNFDFFFFPLLSASSDIYWYFNLLLCFCMIISFLLVCLMLSGITHLFIFSNYI